ncbi:hypothetical protein LJC32_01340 [Oscillospiraceae bacterium OttesenSCG-928-F05]|nr:hypothetical protein [Oscillospiraceae bacterium OttesenSCG-928-F05]
MNRSSESLRTVWLKAKLTLRNQNSLNPNTAMLIKQKQMTTYQKCETFYHSTTAKLSISRCNRLTIIFERNLIMEYTPNKLRVVVEFDIDDESLSKHDTTIDDIINGVIVIDGDITCISVNGDIDAEKEHFFYGGQITSREFLQKNIPKQETNITPD